jgi:hypothetical protein
MRLAAFSLGDTAKASSRLRSFYLFQYAHDFDIEVLRDIAYNKALNCNIVHIQKVLSYQLLFWMPIWRLFHVKVIYDLDDQPGTFRARLGFILAIFFSSILTVDSNSRKDYWLKIFKNKKIVVIPGVLDKKDDTPLVPPRISHSSPDFFWIGHPENLSSIYDFFPILETLNARLLVCTDLNKVDKAFIENRPIDLMDWEEDIAFSNKELNSFIILNHGHDINSIHKSNNKMVLAILAGFIPIASNTQDYELLAKNLNLEFLLFKNFEEIPKIYEEAMKFNWDKIFHDNQAQLVSMYSSKSVLNFFIDNVS